MIKRRLQKQELVRLAAETAVFAANPHFALQIAQALAVNDLPLDAHVAAEFLMLPAEDLRNLDGQILNQALRLALEGQLDDYGDLRQTARRLIADLNIQDPDLVELAR